VLVAELEGGTLTSSAVSMCLLPVPPRVLWMRWWGTWWVVDGVVGTLLGPEGAGDCFFCWEIVLVSYRPGGLVEGPAGAGGVGWAVIFRTLRTAQWTRASSKFL
jgi:hypothetical protein